MFLHHFRGFLKDLIEATHLYTKMLEHYSRRHRHLVVQKKVKKSKRRKKQEQGWFEFAVLFECFVLSVTCDDVTFFQRTNATHRVSRARNSTSSGKVFPVIFRQSVKVEDRNCPLTSDRSTQLLTSTRNNKSQCSVLPFDLF